MLTATDLSALHGSKLDDLFGAAPAGAIPTGIGRGQALIATGSVACRPLAGFARLVAWRGKEFDDEGKTLLNLIGPLGNRAIRADVYQDVSRLDGRPCIVLDYSKTSRVAGWVRDEIREVAPNLYLGLVYVRSKRAPLRFSLQFDPPSEHQASQSPESAHAH